MGFSRKASETTNRKTIPPQRAFLVLGSFFGLILLIVTPPFQVADEPQHFYYSYLVSELRFLSLVELNKDERPLGNDWYPLGAMLPSSLAYLVDGSEMVAIHKQAHRKTQVSKITSLLRLPLRPSSREYLPVAPYPPIAYVPQAAGIAAGRLIGFSPLALFYLARTCALGAWITLVYLAIKKTPLLKWTFCLLALMPMTISLAASNSPDSLTSGVSFLLIAYLLQLAYDQRKGAVNKRDMYYLLVLSIVLTLCKAVYLPIVFLFFLIPLNKFENKRKYFLAFGLVLSASVAVYFLWNLLVEAVVVPGPTISLLRHAVDSPPFSNVSRKEQIALILSNPGYFIDVLVNTFSTLWVFLLNTLVGLLGWVDTWLPSWVPYFYIGMLICTSLLEDSNEMISPKARIISFAILASVVLTSLAYIYTGWNSVGSEIIQGFQGRYLIPVAPVFFIAFINTWFRFKFTRQAAIPSISFAIVILSITTYHVVERFYIETPLTFNIDQFEFSQGDFVFVKGWAIDRTSDSIAAAVFIDIDGTLFRARYGDERTDVADVMKKPLYRYSGFEARIPVSEIGKGQHSIQINIVTRDKDSYDVPKRKVMFNIK